MVTNDAGIRPTVAARSLLFWTGVLPLAVLVLDFQGHGSPEGWPFVDLVPVAGAVVATILAGRAGPLRRSSWPWASLFLVLAVANAAGIFGVAFDPDPEFTQGPSSGRHTLEWILFLVMPFLVPPVALAAGLAAGPEPGDRT